jgi:predicted transposase/invertase (TIGR01784 family)
MEDFSKLFNHKPHDAYFKQVFKVKEVAVQLFQKFLSPQLIERLNLESLRLSSDSFVSDKMKEHFSDLIYNCETLDGDPIRISLLCEHKSYSIGRYIYGQENKFQKNAYFC